jgi:hypothetical protein
MNLMFYAGTLKTYISTGIYKVSLDFANPRFIHQYSKIYGSSNGCPGRKCAWKKNRRVSFPSGAFEDLKTTISTPSLPEHFNLEQLSALPLTPQDSRQRFAIFVAARYFLKAVERVGCLMFA